MTAQSRSDGRPCVGKDGRNYTADPVNASLFQCIGSNPESRKETDDKPTTTTCLTSKYQCDYTCAPKHKLTIFYHVDLREQHTFI